MQHRNYSRNWVSKFWSKKFQWNILNKTQLNSHVKHLFSSFFHHFPSSFRLINEIKFNYIIETMHCICVVQTKEITIHKGKIRYECSSSSHYFCVTNVYCYKFYLSRRCIQMTTNTNLINWWLYPQNHTRIHHLNSKIHLSQPETYTHKHTHMCITRKVCSFNHVKYWRMHNEWDKNTKQRIKIKDTLLLSKSYS